MTGTREIQASAGQRLLWLKLEYEGWSGAYNCPIVCRIDGPLDEGSLKDALGILYARHEALRTTIVRRTRELRQVVHRAGPVAVRTHDLRDAPDAADVQLRDELATPIDPSQCASRMTLWRTGANRHLLCLNLHHLITDSWSCMVLQRELPLLYEQCRTGRPSPLPAIGWQFGQFVAYQWRQIAGEGFRHHRLYWSSQLAGACAPRLPLEPQAGRGPRPRATIRRDIDAAATRAVREVAARYRVTPFTILLAAYYVLLRHVTGQSDLTFGTLFANRVRSEVENTVGFVANLVLLRTQLDGISTFADVVGRVQATLAGSIAHQAFPCHLLPQRSLPDGSGRLDRVVFQMLSERIDYTSRAADVSFDWLVPDIGGRFDLELAVMPLDETFGVKLHYATAGVDRAWADRFLDAYVAGAEAVAAAPDRSLDRIAAAVAERTGPR